MPTAGTPRVLVVGGYGAFGLRAVERLARSGGIEVIVAGRSGEKARQLAQRLAPSSAASVSGLALDAMAPDIARLRACAPSVVLNASGPFQAQDYALARAAIEVGAHYVDLADARAFVTGIGVLDDTAKAAGVLVTSGASSVPALAAAIIDHHLPEFSRLDVIEHAITPANGYDPGVATTQSILGGLGKPMPLLIDGEWTSRAGWLGLSRMHFEGLGTRWMAHCDVPDIEIFPRRYAGVRTVVFRAGLEVGLFQWSLWLLAGAVRAGIIRRPERLAPLLMRLKRAFRFLGSDTGGMVVRLAGLGNDGAPRTRVATLIARQNEGPNVPVIAAVIVARKLASGALDIKGATPCVGLVTLDEVIAEIADLPIEIASRLSGE